MNILQVSPRYPPASGGIERHVKEVSERLVERGHDVSVITTKTGFRQKRESINGVSLHRLPAVAPGNAYHFTPMIAPVVHRSNADLVHAHGYHSFPLLFAAIGAHDVPTVLTPHYFGSEHSSHSWLHELYRPVAGRALQSAEAVIAVSEWEKQQLYGDFGIDAKVIPNGTNVERFSTAEPYESSKKYLLCAGRLVESKGIQYVIDVLTELPEYDLYVAGAGPYESELRDRASKQGVANRVRFLGFVSDSPLQSLYAGAECHITLSDFECYGMTPGESLAAGTPVVVYDRTALSDWKKHEGCIAVDDRSPHTVAKAVNDAIEKRVSSSQIPRWDGVVDRIESVYDRVSI